MWKDNSAGKILTKILTLPYGQFIFLSTLLSFLLDVFNFVFFQQIGLEILLDSPLFSKALHSKALEEGVSLNFLMEQDIKSLYYDTLLFICLAFVVFNFVFYIAAYRLKKWGIDYVSSMNLLGALLGLTMAYEVYAHSKIWFYLLIIQTISYIILSFFMFKRKKDFPAKTNIFLQK